MVHKDRIIIKEHIIDSKKHYIFVDLYTKEEVGIDRFFVLYGISYKTLKGAKDYAAKNKLSIPDFIYKLDDVESDIIKKVRGFYEK